MPNGGLTLEQVELQDGERRLGKMKFPVSALLLNT